MEVDTGEFSVSTCELLENHHEGERLRRTAQLRACVRRQPVLCRLEGNCGCVWMLLLKLKGKVDSMNGEQIIQFETISFEISYSKIPVGMTVKLFPKYAETLVFCLDFKEPSGLLRPPRAHCSV